MKNRLFLEELRIVRPVGPVRLVRQSKKVFSMVELVVALGIIGIALLPLAYGFRLEGKSMQALYYRSVAEQILDGQREILAAGAWRKYQIGANRFEIRNKAFDNLPEGDLKLELSSMNNGKVKIMLSWKAREFKGIGEVRKEAVVQK